jgi:predicted ester cyclase
MKLEEENKALVRELTEQIWNRRRVDQIPNFYSPDFVADYRPYAPERRGHDGIKGMIEGTWAAFPDYHEEIQELIAEGDRVVHLVNSGTRAVQWGPLPPTNKRMEITEIVILQTRDRKVIHQRGVVDNLSALRQLGVIPSPRF